MTGSDLYLVHPGSRPRLIAGREGGTIRNECPAFSPDGRRLAYVADPGQARAIVIVDVGADGRVAPVAHIPVATSGSAPCPGWSADGTQVAYLDGAAVVVHVLDGSLGSGARGAPCAEDFGPSQWSPDGLPSPSGEWAARLASSGTGSALVPANRDRSAPRVLGLAFGPYAIAAWSPDSRQVLLMEDVSGTEFTMHAVTVDSGADVTVVSTVRTNGPRSWPQAGDVSWQRTAP